MALNTNPMRLKCKTELGSFNVFELTKENTVGDLKRILHEQTKIAPNEMRILHGIPPKPIKNDNSLKLEEVDILSGDLLIVETIKPSTAKEPILPQSKTEVIELPPSDVIVNTSSKVDNENEARGVGAAGDTLEDNLFPVDRIMMRHEVPSDNSCLFNSIYFIFHNGVDERKINEYRKIVANTIRSNPEKYNSAFLGMENSKYCTWILSNDHWGGAIELSILSEHFKMEIAVADVTHQQIICFGENENYLKRGFLVYDGIHYDPLVVEGHNIKQTLFNVSEKWANDMALEIAKELHSSRHYVDRANYTLKCEECGAKFKGEKDVQMHALSTGHSRFGQF